MEFSIDNYVQQFIVSFSKERLVSLLNFVLLSSEYTAEIH